MYRLSALEILCGLKSIPHNTLLHFNSVYDMPTDYTMFFSQGDLFILVYSIDNHESFEEIARLINEIFETKGHAHHTHNHLPHFRHQNGSTQSISTLVTASGNSGSPQSGGSPVTSGVVIAGSSSGPGSSRSSVLSRSSSRHSPPLVIVGNKSDREGSRVVDTMELTRLVESVSQCVGVETSAKKNINIEEVFVALFVLARLPTEMSPSLHRRVPPTYVGGSTGAGSGSVGKSCSDIASSCSNSHGQSPRSKLGFIASWRSKKTGDSAVCRTASGGGGGGSLLTRRRLSDACGAVAPNVRRPSIRTDLLLLQTRRSRAGGLFGSSGSSSVGSLGLSVGLGTAAAVAGVCAGVGASSKKNEASKNDTAEDSRSGDDVAEGHGCSVLAGRVIGSSDVIGSSSKCVVQ